jgi:ATP-binding cassette subfamily F protein 3
MLNFSDVSVRRGKRVLFSGASFSLFRGEKVGLTGENGSGKSSLMALVRGEIQPEAGSFEMPAQLQLAHVSQELLATDQIAIEFVLDGDAELRQIERRIGEAERDDDGERLGELYAAYAAIGGYDARSRAGRLLHGLGFASADETRPVRAFSGGWRVRLNVAQALMCRSDLLLLDEPTNHLDLDAILWLENWLREYPGTLLLIAHDREFLDGVTNRIVNIEHGQAHAYRGNYSAFELQRAAELAEQSALYQRQQREIRHMESFVERFRAQATKARQAQSRLKALERMQRIAPAHVDSPFTFSFSTPAKLPRPLLALERQAAGYGERPVIAALSLTLAPGARLGLLGRNGAGKSTLMKLLAGALPARGGTRTEARDLRIGYFAQHQLEQLDVAESPLEHLQRIDTELGGGRRSPEQTLRDFLAGFGFPGERVFEPVAPFSGGEKARLVLALLAYQRPNLMLLDEPTNHLDLEMRQALSVALQDYEGAVVLVSHDRHLLSTVADEFLLVHAGKAVPFDGDLSDYARWLGQEAQEAEAAHQAQEAQAAHQAQEAQPAHKAQEPETAEGRKQRRRLTAQRRAALGPLRDAVATHERELERLGQARVRIELEIAQAAGGTDQPGIARLLREQGTLVRAIAAAEAAWLAATERLESQRDAVE